MSAENRVLTTLIWLRHYPTYALISLCFAVSVSTVDNSTWTDFWEMRNREIQWPSIPVWRQKRGH
jgi:hypothetical protein